jgi:hypothetical protein
MRSKQPQKCKLSEKSKHNSYAKPLCIKALVGLNEGSDKKGIVNSIPGLAIERLSS